MVLREENISRDVSCLIPAHQSLKEQHPAFRVMHIIESTFTSESLFVQLVAPFAILGCTLNQFTSVPSLIITHILSMGIPHILPYLTPNSLSLPPQTRGVSDDVRVVES